MDFEPINDDHAIEEVAFACVLNRRVAPVELRQLISMHDQVSEELPAVIGDGEPPAGLQFSYLRPNGSATWTLQFADNAIAVSCTRYTRWERVWSMAQRFLLLGLSALREGDKTSAVALAFTVNDRFQGQTETPSVGALLMQSDLLMPGAFTMQSMWHSHVGWFDDARLGGRVLNHLNIDLRSEIASAPDTGEQRQLPAVTIAHVQQFRPSMPMPVAGLAEAGGVALADAMSYMHDQNKRTLGRLLTPEMRDRIQLQGSA